MDRSADNSNNMSTFSIQDRLDRKAWRKQILAGILPFSGLVFIIVFFIVVTGGALIRASNLENLVNQCFTLMIVSVGATFVYAHGGMDFSIGATCGLAQMIGGLLLVRANVPIAIVLLLTVMTGVVCSVIVVSASLLSRVPVFVTSLCMRTIAAGILSTVLRSNEVRIPFGEYQYINNTPVRSITLVIVVLAGLYLFEFTSLGKSVKAIGGNAGTAAQSGINTGKTKLIAYVIMGGCVGIVAVFSMFRSSIISAMSGGGLEYSALIALVIGGLPLTGGDNAKLQSAIIGAITVTVLYNGLTLWGLDPGLVNGIRGALFLIIVGLSYDRSRGKLVT